MKKTLLVLAGLFTLFTTLKAQTIEELTLEKETKAAELAVKKDALKALTGDVDALQLEVDRLTDLVTPYPRWKTGVRGNVGINFASFTNWFSKAQHSTTALNLGTSLTGFADMEQRKYFWRNGGNLTLAWVKFDDRNDPNDITDLRVAADALNLTSLFGYKLSSKIAVSALAEYRTAVLEGRFNNPGYLDLGVGITWTPITDLTVVIHPLNYNFVFSRGAFDYQSSLGAKLVADYKRQITPWLFWKSNASAFISYEGQNLSNWTWVNNLTASYNRFGIGLDVGLRGNKQEALALELTDNPIQTYWILGLTYTIGK